MLDRTDGLSVETKLRHTLGQLEEAQRFARARLAGVSTRAAASSNGRSSFRSIAGFDPDITPRPELFIERLVPEDRARFQVGLQRMLADRLADPRDAQIDGRVQRPNGEVRHPFGGLPVRPRGRSCRAARHHAGRDGPNEDA